jgi:hypothetical protein
MPAAVPAAAPHDLVDTVRYTEQPLPANAQAVVRIGLELPPGWKVNPQAPAALTVAVAGDGVHVPPAYATQTLHLSAPEVTILLHVAQEGRQAQLRIDLTFVLCQVDNQGFCALQQVAWEVPVRTQARAAAELALRYVVAPL